VDSRGGVDVAAGQTSQESSIIIIIIIIIIPGFFPLYERILDIH
jgi:hypothetical protein